LGPPEATSAAIVDGWFSTYDNGCVDDDGYFYIAAEKGPGNPGRIERLSARSKKFSMCIPPSARPPSSASPMKPSAKGGPAQRDLAESGHERFQSRIAPPVTGRGDPVDQRLGGAGLDESR
jgi:hypothetical protein